MIAETDHCKQVEQSSKLLDKNMVVQINEGQVTLYFSSKLQRSKIFDHNLLTDHGAFKGNDVILE